MTTSGLSEVQALFHRLVTAPENVEQALESLAIARAKVEGAFGGDARLSAVERLDVYADMYFFRIRDVLREQFERVARALGDEAFHALVVDFLAAHPPETPSLREVGERLGRFLEMHPFSSELPWLPDLARFEWLVLDAFDAADAVPLDANALRSTPPDEFASLALALHPSARVLASRFGVDVEPVRETPCTLLVWRHGGDVRFRRTDALEAAALELVRRGATFGEVCELVAERVPEVEAAPRALELLMRWLADELLASVSG